MHKIQKILDEIIPFLLDCGINNAYLLQRILYNFDNLTLEHGKFYEVLITQMFTLSREMRDEDNGLANQPKKSKDLHKAVHRTNINHYYDQRIHSDLVHFPSVSKVRGRCKLCAINDLRSEVYFQCDICDVHLCLNSKRNCFKEFHTEIRL
jgi:uncharacterized protein YlaN (UPF0358 family)